LYIMRSFVILSLLASTFAAPVPQLTGALGNAIPGVNQISQLAGQAASPVTGMLPGVLQTLDGVTGSKLPSTVVTEVASTAGNLKRSPITEALNAIPGVETLVELLGETASPATDAVYSGLNAIGSLPGGSVVSDTAKSLLGSVGSLKRRALTSIAGDLPVVPQLTQGAGQLLKPVTGGLTPQIEQQLQALPNGPAFISLLNSALSAASNVKREI
jgi:hypothetical protein